MKYLTVALAAVLTLGGCASPSIAAAAAPSAAPTSVAASAPASAVVDSTDATPVPTAQTQQSTDPTPIVGGEPVASRGVVSRIVDGDTVWVTEPGGAEVDVRLLGIDTPETHKPGTPVQCWGPEATRYAEQTRLGQQVTLVTDPTQDKRDRYGRLLAYVRLADGQDYSIEAARAGAAHSYVHHDRPVVEHAAIAAAEAEAHDARRGLWGACPS